MSGNVWRFTADPWLGSYEEMAAAGASVNQAGFDSAIRRVVRGGSWGAKRGESQSAVSRQPSAVRCPRDGWVSAARNR